MNMNKVNRIKDQIEEEEGDTMEVGMAINQTQSILIKRNGKLIMKSTFFIIIVKRINLVEAEVEVREVVVVVVVDIKNIINHSKVVVEEEEVEVMIIIAMGISRKVIRNSFHKIKSFNRIKISILEIIVINNNIIMIINIIIIIIIMVKTMDKEITDRKVIIRKREKISTRTIIITTTD